ncbi:hypothetical protein Tcan_07779 [Toxocara canis]|uniref:Receptor ligand binding region domain-containing protein n=1 Tax=Toxocara canis TaxID=6265 RepID=A0A0B2URK4_TOXCA|nr:hypothetical protein Tcan_07779 [Toxocara canis]
MALMAADSKSGLNLYVRGRWVTIFRIGIALCAMMRQYNWTEFGLVYSASSAGISNCYYLEQDLESALTNFPTTLALVYVRIVPTTISNFSDVLDELSQRARIVITCFEEDAQKWKFVLQAKAKGMSTPEYVYIFPDVDNIGYGIGDSRLWDNKTALQDSKEAIEALQYALIVRF